jgi:signal transduction histidine kinase
MSKGSEDNDSILHEVFAALDVMVTERLADGTLRGVGAVPGWFTWLFPQAGGGERLPLGRFSPFLADFLAEAEEFWGEQRPGQLRSGAWSQPGATGREDHLEAVALTVGARHILLIELLGSAYEERRRLLQVARDHAHVGRQLARETQKKELLLDRLVHDLAGLLTGVKVSFSLLDAEPLSANGREYLALGRRQHAEQQRLIREVTEAFAAEVEPLATRRPEQARTVDALACARETLRHLTPAAALHKVRLQLDAPPEAGAERRVAGEQARLERVLMNLIENALDHSPPFSTVRVALREDATHVQINVDDEGVGVPPERVSLLFQPFARGEGQAGGEVGVGLYYCRRKVERWGGTIGYLPRQPRGARFWVRLPKLTAG